MTAPTASSSRDALHRVTVHVLARARIASGGRFSLRVAPGGPSTPDLRPDGPRLRISGGHLLVESDAPGSPAVTAIALGGATLRELAALASVDLTTTIDVGHDTPPLGDIDAPLDVDAASAAAIGRWFTDVAAILDGVVTALPTFATPTLPRLWPEHFDVAVEAQATAARRVNLGGSPGDGFRDEPYLYVGPWTPDRPGDADFWNAPFGALRTRAELAAGGDPVAAGIAFLLDGYGRLAS